MPTPTLAQSPQLLSTPTLPAPHAFATRWGGVSQGQFATLNFGNPSTLAPQHRDPKANILENFRLTLHAMGVEGRTIVQVHQVHGAGVRVLRAGQPLPDGDQPDPQADALVTDDPRLVVCVRTADCAPVLLSDEGGRVVAAVHAGWRGVCAGVLPEAIRAMRGLGAVRFHAAIGPCIGPGAFEVGPEVVAAFRAAFPYPADQALVIVAHPDGHARDLGKAHVDLQQALTIQLRDHAGILPQSVARVGGCTVRTRDDAGQSLFFSHRRDGEGAGRLASLIGPREPGPRGQGAPASPSTPTMHATRTPKGN